MGYHTFPPHRVNVTERNCKVVKKVAPPISISTLFSGLSPLSRKNFCPTQFLEGPTLPLPFLNHIFHVTAPTIKSLTEVLYV